MSPTRQNVTIVTSSLLVIIGVAMIVRTIIAGVGGLASGLFLGVLFVFAGIGRLWLARQQR